MIDTLLEFQRAGRVRRYHTWDNTTTQNIAAHSHGVAIILMAVHPQASRELLCYAILHDLGEVFTGDILGPTKWANPSLKDAADQAEASWWEEQPEHLRPPALSQPEKTLLKICDLLELVFHSSHEFAMGNQYARVTMVRGLEYLDRILKDPELVLPEKTLGEVKGLTAKLWPIVHANYKAVVQK